MATQMRWLVCFDLLWRDKIVFVSPKTIFQLWNSIREWIVVYVVLLVAFIRRRLYQRPGKVYGDLCYYVGNLTSKKHRFCAWHWGLESPWTVLLVPLRYLGRWGNFSNKITWWWELVKASLGSVGILVDQLLANCGRCSLCGVLF